MMQKKFLGFAEDLEKLSAEIVSLRQPGRKLLLPEDLKRRVCSLLKAGVSLAEIRRHTGVQAVSIRLWEQDFLKEKPTRKFKILKVVETNHVHQTAPAQVSEPHAHPARLLFRYPKNDVVLEIDAAQLTPELMRILTLC